LHGGQLDFLVDNRRRGLVSPGEPTYAAVTPSKYDAIFAELIG
jgi:hypothetical protein